MAECRSPQPLTKPDTKGNDSHQKLQHTKLKTLTSLKCKRQKTLKLKTLNRIELLNTNFHAIRIGSLLAELDPSTGDVIES
ncbi:hypothetical protein JHK84_048069 [Glycine max]|nr:hypothetical protein JHK84_048069 [Glycine max]